jgi:WD40 repeat protein
VFAVENTISGQSNLLKFDQKTGVHLQTFKNISSTWVTCLTLTPDSTLLFLVDASCTFYLFTTQTSTFTKLTQLHPPSPPSPPSHPSPSLPKINPIHNIISSLFIPQTQDTLYCVNTQGSLLKYTFTPSTTKKPIPTVIHPYNSDQENYFYLSHAEIIHPYPINVILPTYDGYYFFTFDSKGIIKQFTTISVGLIQDYHKVHSGAILAAVITPDDRWLFSGDL